MRNFFSACLLIFAFGAARRVVAEGTFRQPEQKSLLDEILAAPIVVIGKFQNAKAPKDASEKGSSELVIEEILVPHELMKARKSLMIDRYIAQKDKYVVLFNLLMGKLEPGYGRPLDEKGETLKFIRGALDLKDKSKTARLRFVADWLASSSELVVESAVKELSRASYADLRKAAETLKPEPIVTALQDPKTNEMCLAAYARMLGHCGRKEHAAALKKVIDTWPVHRGGEILYNAVLSYVQLDPDAGWDFVVKQSESKETKFLQRYAAFRAIRTLADAKVEFIEPKKCMEGIAGFLRAPDMADLAIRELRLRKQWGYCEAILSLHGKKGFDSSIVSVNILRYALRCPDPAAKQFVMVQRTRDPDWVADVEESLLLLETEEA